MESPALIREKSARGVATLTLNRPDVRNAFDDDLILSLTESLLQLKQDPGVRVVVLTGAGQTFCSGADIAWMRSMAQASEEENFEDSLRLAELLSVLDSLGKPSIARVNGNASGGGVGLIAACDIAVAATTATFALSEVRLGLIPAVIAPYVVPAIGPRQARRYFLTGEPMSATTAAVCGLVHETVPIGELDTAVATMIDGLLAGGPSAQREAKEIVATVAHSPGTSAMTMMRRTAEVIAQLRVSSEGQEGLNAFLEKRPPRWHR